MKAPVGRVAVTTGIAAAVVVLTATPALAAISLDISGSHLSNGQIRENDRITASGTGSATDPTGLSGSRTVKLSVRTPSDGSYTFDSKSVPNNKDSQISAVLDTTCAPWSGCRPAANGTYTFVYDDGNRSSSKDVTLAIPPATPTGFDASTDGTVATFDWQPNAEPDLMGYAILDGSTDVTGGGVDAGSVCDGSGCEVTIDFGTGVRGTQHTFSVVALRHTSPGSSGSLDSPASAGKTVTFAAETAPSGSPSGGGTGTGSGAGTGSGTGSGGGGSRTSGGGGGHGAGGSAPSGKHAAADLRSTLPTLSAGAAPNLPSVLTEVKPLPQGSYKPVLPYGDHVTREKVTRPSVAGITASRVDGVAKVLDTAKIWRGLGLAAVLLLVAGHLHSWTRRVELD